MDRWDVHEVPDTGRRGEPRLGCDCVYCWGQCILDHDLARRELPDADEMEVAADD